MIISVSHGNTHQDPAGDDDDDETLFALFIIDSKNDSFESGTTITDFFKTI